MKEKRKYIFLIVLFIVFITVLMLNLLTPMVADDYMYSFSFATKDRIQSVSEIFPSLVKHAQVLNGRIIPDFFVHLFLLLPRAIFSILNSVIFIVFILGMYRLIKASQSKYDWQLLLILTGAVFLFPIAFGQTNLWLTGSINYLWRDTLMVWVFVPFSDIVIRKKNITGSWKWFFIAAASLYIGNSTENTSTSAILFMGLCILWQLLQKRKVYAWMLIAIGFTLLGWLLLVFSPGTSRDMSSSSASLNQIAQHFGVALDMWRKHGLWLSVAYFIVFFFSKRLHRSTCLFRRAFHLFRCQQFHHDCRLLLS